jgi:L-aminopeptidase/D-esterase-like protein
MSRVGNGLTDVPGIKVGHCTLTERPTGCTVVLTEAGAVAGIDQRGAAPATRETDLLDPTHTIQHVHAVVLTGGSAFGLDAATGVMRYLEERGVGFETGIAIVPIVPAASLYDLRVGGRPDIRPDAECGYRAAASASDGPVAEGNVGAGAGATVGKSGDGAMKAGIGTASVLMPSGLIVAALMAVNAVGDIIDPATGQVIAGSRTPDGGGFADARRLLRAGRPPRGRVGQNTTIGVVATNARLSKPDAARMAQLAYDGCARAISPHTIFDGDTIFALATGTHRAKADLSLVGGLAAEVVADAIVRAATQARGIPGYPAAGDVRPDTNENDDRIDDR